LTTIECLIKFTFAELLLPFVDGNIIEIQIIMEKMSILKKRINTIYFHFNNILIQKNKVFNDLIFFFKKKKSNPLEVLTI